MKGTFKFVKQLLAIIMLSGFLNCSSAQKLQEKAPIGLGQVYVQKWASGVKGGESGFNVFIPITDHAVSLDSIYFRNRTVQLEIVSQPKLMYFGKFVNPSKEAADMILSSDPKEESKNRYIELQKNFPFELKDDECVISYSSEGKIRYFKVSGITEKEPQYFPSAPKGQ